MRAKVGGLLRSLADDMKLRLERDYEERVKAEAPRIKEKTDAQIAREYAACGEEPTRTSSGLLVSRSLTKLIADKKRGHADEPHDPMVL
jgi:hypothetical protein